MDQVIESRLEAAIDTRLLFYFNFQPFQFHVYYLH